MVVRMENNGLSNEDLEKKRVPCEVWTRVMGYHRPVENFNIGKKAEHKNRVPFKEESFPSEDTTYLLFTTGRCVKCPAMKEAVKNKVEFSGVVIDDTHEDFSVLADSFRVTSVPTLIFVKGGAEVDRFHDPSEL